tara:strand:- start:163 stop:408 length:246 start_codon:yes stop_codon:yes gene_type:complete
MPTPKKKSTKRAKKPKLDKKQLAMAQRYEKAWHELFYQRARFAQEEIIAHPDGRRAKELAHEVAKLAESWEWDEENSNGKE